MKLPLLIILSLLISSCSFAKSSISGELNYPADELPPLKVCAVEITTSTEVCIKSKQAQTKYTIDLKPGRYNVFASIIDPIGDIKSSYKAYFTEFVLCGLKKACPSHEIIEVVLKEGEQKKNINPQDWSR